ncbi:Rrf2 family transcriptional regulator [Candidatus Falkowbacteria bacterium]|nr:Rrf2 family transcriptional regulator [Candidatus Falkowbacteria bacterium]
MKISTKSQYGLRALLAMAKAKSTIKTVADVAKLENISKDYLEKIFAKMERANFVKSIRGAMGGYVLARPLKKITVKEFLIAMDGEIVPVQCVSGIKCPMSKKCKAKNIWSKVKDKVEHALSTITLDKLI